MRQSKQKQTNPPCRQLATKSCAEQPPSTVNQPKNYFIKDATVPFEFNFYRFGSKVSVNVQQTPAEELWPGGALWDLGVLLSRILVLLTRGASLTNSSTGGSNDNVDRMQKIIPDIAWKNTSVLELGCGVGLTGLVAAALGARTVVLTDLQHVVDGITCPNMKLNFTPSGGAGSNMAKTRAGGHVVSAPLCWGNKHDELAVLELLNQRRTKSQSCNRRKKKSATNSDESQQEPTLVDIILIGDVAYQHKPGAPSHFEALVSTLMNFVSSETLVIFGTRMRMPASVDLLHMFHEYLDEVLVPPLEASEIDSALEKKNHMTIHFLKKRRNGTSG